MSQSSENLETSQIIRELDYIEVLQSDDQIYQHPLARVKGAGASADTYANAQTAGNIAYANAAAAATGSMTVTHTASKAHVRSYGYVTVGRSYAVSFAIARHQNQVDASGSAAAAANVSLNR